MFEDKMPPPSFLFPLQPVPAPEVGAVAQGISKELQFVMQHQEEDNWCWAACAASIYAYLNSSATWKQCSIASNCLPGTPDCCSDPTQGDILFQLDAALKTCGNLKDTIADSMSVNDISTELLANCPIGCHIAWQNGGGHFVVIFGFDSSTGDVSIADPGWGNQTIPFSSFVENYRDEGTWDYSYRTQRAI